MEWVVVRRTRMSRGKTFVYSEIMLNFKGEFNEFNQDAAVFPTKEQAQFVANGFELRVNIEYIVKPYEHPEIE